VEEWCEDWYGPYKAGRQVDPLGYAAGDFRVTRGGSHSTFVYYLRSANRLATLPEDKHWLIGFRVVIGEMPETEPLAVPRIPLHQRDVVQRDREVVSKGPDPDMPYFKEPRRFVKIPSYERGPIFGGHNHNPAIAECPNGDMLAIWYTCVSEKDRELAQAASRLRYGKDEWEQASPFWNVPERNDHAPTLWFDGKETLYHICGISTGPTYSLLSLVIRTSKDSGATWSRARIVSGYNDKNKSYMASEPMLRLNDGSIALGVDRGPLLFISKDEGLTWFDSVGVVPGIHPGVVHLDTGRLFMMARGHYIDGRMPIAVSDDMGKTWYRRASEFPGIGGSQRLVLLNLREGAVFLASFADKGLTITDSSGTQREVRGLFGALSYDGGMTWPVKKLISEGGRGTVGECTNGGLFIRSGRNSEYRGYLAGCQGLDDVIHVVSSRSHYAFNLNWLETPAPELKYPPYRVKAMVETFDQGDKYDNKGWVDYHDHTGGFNGKGQYTINSTSHFNGINHIVGEGSFEMNFSFKNIRYNPRGDTSSPGITIWIKDAQSQHHAFDIRDDSVRLNNIIDVEYTTPPTEAKLRIVYNEKNLEWHMYYGLNGDEAVKELDVTKKGFFSREPLTESTAMYILMSCCSADVDHYEIKPL
ncbi:MAG: exo-alpha-sialidase, partial [Planctomycetota bacterium]